MSDFILSAFADEAGASLDEQIAALQRNGIRYMEIRSVDGLNICKTPLETVVEYKKKLDAAGIKVVTIGSCIGKLNLDDNYEEHIAMFLHTLGVAKILGATRIRMFSVFLPQDGNAGVYREKVHAWIKEMLDIAEPTGVALYHENEKDIYGDVACRVRDLMDTFGERMKFIFDPANFVQCGCDTLKVYDELKDGLAYFHIKDAKASDNEVVPAGSGDGNIGAILRDYAKDHKNTMLTLEPHLMTFAGLKDLGDEVSIKEETKYVYKDNAEAFDVAANALKRLLENEGLSYE